jgi:hypothetical protein
MGQVYHPIHPIPLGRRPYIPAGCDQQQRLRDGARAELPQVGLGAVPLVAIIVGAAFWGLVLVSLGFWSY